MATPDAVDSLGRAVEGTLDALIQRASQLEEDLFAADAKIDELTIEVQSLEDELDHE